MHSSPIFNPKGVVDLGQVDALAKLREAQREQRQISADQERLIAWDKGMRKMLKGIVPRSTRLIFLRAEGRRLEQQSR